MELAVSELELNCNCATLGASAADVLTTSELELELNVKDGAGISLAWDETSGTDVLKEAVVVLDSAGAALVSVGTSATDVLTGLGCVAVRVFTESELELETSTTAEVLEISATAEVLPGSELEVADCIDDVEEVIVCCVHAHVGLLSAQ